jgi:hypothetical protein
MHTLAFKFKLIVGLKYLWSYNSKISLPSVHDVFFNQLYNSGLKSQLDSSLGFNHKRCFWSVQHKLINTVNQARKKLVPMEASIFSFGLMSSVCDVTQFFVYAWEYVGRILNLTSLIKVVDWETFIFAIFWINSYHAHATRLDWPGYLYQNQVMIHGTK